MMAMFHTMRRVVVIQFVKAHLSMCVWKGSINVSEYINYGSKTVMKQRYKIHDISVIPFEKHHVQIKIKTIIWYCLKALNYFHRYDVIFNGINLISKIGDCTNHVLIM